MQSPTASSTLLTPPMKKGFRNQNELLVSMRGVFLEFVRVGWEGLKTAWNKQSVFLWLHQPQSKSWSPQLSPEMSKQRYAFFLSLQHNVILKVSAASWLHGWPFQHSFPNNTLAFIYLRNLYILPFIKRSLALYNTHNKLQINTDCNICTIRKPKAVI